MKSHEGLQDRFNSNHNLEYIWDFMKSIVWIEQNHFINPELPQVG